MQFAKSICESPRPDTSRMCEQPADRWRFSAIRKTKNCPVIQQRRCVIEPPQMKDMSGALISDDRCAGMYSSAVRCADENDDPVLKRVRREAQFKLKFVILFLVSGLRSNNRTVRQKKIAAGTGKLVFMARCFTRWMIPLKIHGKADAAADSRRFRSREPGIANFTSANAIRQCSSRRTSGHASVACTGYFPAHDGDHRQCFARPSAGRCSTFENRAGNQYCTRNISPAALLIFQARSSGGDKGLRRRSIRAEGVSGLEKMDLPSKETRKRNEPSRRKPPQVASRKNTTRIEAVPANAAPTGSVQAVARHSSENLRKPNRGVQRSLKTTKKPARTNGRKEQTQRNGRCRCASASPRYPLLKQQR